MNDDLFTHIYIRPRIDFINKNEGRMLRKIYDFKKYR